MKHSLFLLLALEAVPGIAGAQTSGTPSTPETNQNFQPHIADMAAPPVVMVCSESVPKPTPRRSKDDGNYYRRDFGTYYRNYYGTGTNISDQVQIVTAPFTPLTFTNMNSDKSGTTWTYYNESTSQWEDLEADGDGNYTMQVSKVSTSASHHMPVINKGESRFFIGQFSGFDGSGNAQWSGSPSHIATPDLFGTDGYSVTDNAVVYGYFSSFGTGSGSFYGSNKPGGTIAPVKAVWQCYPKPIAPLALQRITWTGNSFNLDKSGSGGDTIPIRDGYALHVYIIAGHDRAGTDTLAKMQVTKDDVISRSWLSTSQCWYFQYQCVHRVDDGNGNMVAKPLVIDQPFTIVFEGFDAATVDVGFNNCNQKSLYYESDRSADLATAESWGIPPTKITFGGTTVFWIIDSNARIFLDAIFDVARLADGDTLIAPVGGGTCFTMKDDTPIYGLRYHSTRRYRTAGTAEPNYLLSELPFWLSVEKHSIADYSASKGWIHSFVLTADPLPEDICQRTAEVYVYSELGAKTEKVTIVQDGTTGVKTIDNEPLPNDNSATYNLAGQRVADGYKGIVIQHGRKVVRK